MQLLLGAILLSLLQSNSLLRGQSRQRESLSLLKRALANLGACSAMILQQDSFIIIYTPQKGRLAELFFYLLDAMSVSKSVGVCHFLEQSFSLALSLSAASMSRVLLHFFFYVNHCYCSLLIRVTGRKNAYNAFYYYDLDSPWIIIL